MKWNHEKYMAAKEHWLALFQAMEPRNDSEEEIDAFSNALDDFCQSYFHNAA